MINILQQIQNLLNTYQRQQLQSRLAEAKARSFRKSSSKEEQQEDRVIISAEAKRIQLYQRMAGEVLKRMREEKEELGAHEEGPSDLSGSVGHHTFE
jgi:hypothetical protein